MPMYLIPVYFIFLAAVWGASFMFMRVGVPEFGSFTFAGLRVGLAALVLLPLLLSPKRLPLFKRYWFRLSVIGIIMSGLPFLLYSLAAQSLNAGVASVINAATPLMTGVIAHLFFRDYLTRRQFVGLLIGVLGVSVLMMDSLQQQTGSLWSFLSALLACLCYGIGGNLSKRFLADVPALTIAASGLLASAVVMLPVIGLTFPTQSISLLAWGSVGGIAILSTAIAMAMFYALIKVIGPTRAVSITLLVPVFGIFWGVLLLDESLSAMMMIGAVIIIIATGLAILPNKSN